ncbi:MAG: NAD(P)-dependent oxidoreductase [Acidimicrobiales bacterium]
MHVLFADATAQSAIDTLNGLGHTVAVRSELTADDLVGQLDEVDALVVRSTRVNEAALGSSGQLALIVRAGAGVENIDMGAASSRGVHVCNVPGRNAVAVAELTMGLLLAVDRHIALATADLKEGVWNKRTYSKADGVMGRTMGIIGLGEIGLRVAERAKAFGLVVIGQRRPGRSADMEARIRAIGIRLVDTTEELVAESDIVSLHVPANSETASLVDAALLEHFRDNAILLNTSRGDCVDEQALRAAIESKGIRAGLDVFRDEPGAGGTEFHSALAKHPSVVGTHHVGASTSQAQPSITEGVVEAIEAFAAGAPLNCVNLAPRGMGGSSLAIRHYDRVGVLAAIFGVLRGAGLNVQHMENRVFEGRSAAVASIDVSDGFNDSIKAELEALPDVLGVAVLRSAAS